MKLSSIKLNPDNPRQIKDAKFEALKKSIEEYPEMMALRPIVIDDKDIVIGGNMRLRALRDLGFKEVPDEWILKSNELTEEQRRHFIAVDNVSFGEWDWDELSGWDAGELTDWGVDLPVDFEDDESKDGLTGDDEIPEPEEPICKTGDLWQLGRHRLLCGDATKKEDVERLMDGNKADMVFTDPPYGMNLDTDYTTMGAKSQKHKKVIGDDKPFVWFDIGAKEQFWFGADYYIETIQRDYDNLGSWFVWDKYPTDQNDKRFGSAFELIWSKQNHQRKIIRIGSLNVGHHKREAIVHPTQKPSDLICKFLEDYSTAGQIIWDGFLGSGSTLIAAEKTNRKCYGMEIDPHYCDVIIKRFEDYTGEKAVKI